MVQVTKVRGYQCPACDELHEGEPPAPRLGWRIIGDVGGPDEDLTLDRPVEVMVFECEEGEWFTDPPVRVEGWQCPECEEIYQDAEEAASCCA